MSTKIQLLSSSIRNKIHQFKTDTQGAYAVMMVLLSAVLIGYIAFIVDGSGLILDKVRFTQGVEQAGFLLTAENNDFRKEKDIYQVNSQEDILSPEEIGKIENEDKRNNISNLFMGYLMDQKGDPKNNSSYKRYVRNIQMIKGIVRTYYLPNSFTAFDNNSTKDNNYKILDMFKYQCDEIKNTSNIGCIVNGSFKRPSWLYWGDEYKKEYGTSFNKTELVKANTAFITKRKNENPPIDMMLITDMSGSMNDLFPENPTEKKIDALRNAFTTISDEMLKNTHNNYNRIGFTSFSYGAQPFNFSNPDSTKNSCLLPYMLKDRALQSTHKSTIEDKNYKDPELDNISRDILCYHESGSTKCINKNRRNYAGKYICKNRDNGKPFYQPIKELGSSICHCPPDGCGWDFNEHDKKDENGNIIDKYKQWDRKGDLISVLKNIDVKGPSYKVLFETEFNNFDKYYCPEKIPSKDPLGNPTLVNNPNWNQKNGEIYIDHLHKRHELSRGLSGKIPYNGKAFYPIDIDGSLNLIDKFKANKPYPDSNYMIQINKGNLCFKNDSNTTTALWFDQSSKNNLKTTFKKITPNDLAATLASSGVLVGAHLMMNKNTNQNVQPKNLKMNTKRYIVILADGIDGGENTFYDTPLITLNLINAGMCERIRKKIDSLQDKNYPTFPTKISFITLGTSKYQIDNQGLENTLKFEKAWKKCVGEKNYFSVSSQKELLEALRVSSGLTEEVGTATDSKPNFKN